MEPCFPPFDIADWRAVAAIEDRAATQDDVNRCQAVFSTGPGQSAVVATAGLPARAWLTDENGKRTEVVIVQIEKQIGGDMTVVGYVLPSGGNGVATLPDVEIQEYSN